MTWQVDSSGIGRGSVTLDSIIGYNGAWDSSWGSTSSRSAYAGRNKYYTVIKLTISTDYNNGSGSGWIAIAAITEICTILRLVILYNSSFNNRISCSLLFFV